MESFMYRHAGNTRTSDIRRARTLAGSLVFVLTGAALYAHNVSAAECGAKSDFLVKADPLLASVRPVDCSRLFQAPADFSWPAAQGVRGYIVALTFPDGHVEELATATNWLAWPAALPAGEYRWTVTASGGRLAASTPRSFTVDATAVACAITHWDEARRECVDVPGAVATAARFSSWLS
jgi:hypothetical protein